MARRPAIKKVLSPISERKISANAARKPDFPNAELVAHSCTGKTVGGKCQKRAAYLL
jgi:hypothetical protein